MISRISNFDKDKRISLFTNEDDEENIEETKKELKDKIKKSEEDFKKYSSKFEKKIKEFYEIINEKDSNFYNLKEKNRILEDQLNENINTLNSEREEIIKLRNLITELKIDNKKFGEEGIQRNMDYEVIIKQRDISIKKFNILNAEKEKYSMDNEKLKNEIFELEKIIKKLTDDISNLFEENEKLKEKYEKLETIRNNLIKEIETNGSRFWNPLTKKDLKKYSVSSSDFIALSNLNYQQSLNTHVIKSNNIKKRNNSSSVFYDKEIPEFNNFIEVDADEENEKDHENDNSNCSSEINNENKQEIENENNCLKEKTMMNDILNKTNDIQNDENNNQHSSQNDDYNENDKVDNQIISKKYILNQFNEYDDDKNLFMNKDKNEITNKNIILNQDKDEIPKRNISILEEIDEITIKDEFKNKVKDEIPNKNILIPEEINNPFKHSQNKSHKSLIYRKRMSLNNILGVEYEDENIGKIYIYLFIYIRIKFFS